jgi:two-component system, NarL family, response regulator NreC
MAQVSRTSPRRSSGDGERPALELSPDAGTSSPTPGLHARVLLVEEYGLVRRGLQLQLEADSRYKVCGGVRNPAEAVAGSFAPDLVVSELLFHEVQGPPVVARLRNAFPEASILVLTRVGNPAYVHLALDAGANGYILKDAPPEDFLLAVHRVAAGQEYVQPQLGAAVARWKGFGRRQRPESLTMLTRREEEVIELLALGHTNTEIAAMLTVALRTVEAHRSHVLQKLGLTTRAEIIRYVSENGHVAP